MKQFLSSVSGFAASGIITGLATLVSLPLLIRLHGPAVWSIFAVGQAAGLLLAVPVGFGWAVLGPAIIARLAQGQRRTEYFVSVCVRLILFMFLCLVAGALVLFHLASTVEPYLPVTLAFASTGFSSLWYYVGTGQSWASFCRDALPRAVATALAPLLSLWGPVQLTLGIVLGAGNIVGLIATTLYVRRESRGSAPEPVTWPQVRVALVRQRPGLISGCISSVYMTLPTIIVGAMASNVGSFALGDKFVRLASTATLPLTQVLQGWVPRATIEERPFRVRRALRSMGVIAVLLGILLAALAPFIAVVFSKGQVPVDWTLSLPMGFILACTLITQVVGAGCLPAYGDYNAVAISAAIGAGVGLPFIFGGTYFFGGAGTMSAVAIAEVAVLLFQLLRLRVDMKY